jgi:hypothetical protein
VRKSVDGGRRFVPVSDGYLLTEQVHPDVHGFVHDPAFEAAGAKRRVYVVGDGGVFVTDNVETVSTTKGWKSLNAGYATAQYYSGAGHGPTQMLIGGTQDNGTLRLEKVQKATLPLGGDGGFVAIDRQRPRFVYGEYVALQLLFRSRDGGKRIESFIDERLPERGQGNWIAPLVLDPNDGNRMYAGARHLWRSANVRTGKPPRWTAIKPPDDRGGRVENVATIGVSRADSDLVWVGDNDGRVHLSRNARAAAPGWETVDDNAGTDPLPDRFPTRVVPAWDDTETAWIGLGGFRDDNVWRTRDGGRSWRSASGREGARLPAAPVRGLAQHPANPDWLYAGTEVGVFASEDGGDSWATVNEGPASVSVDELRFLDGSTTLLAATHGRGL